MITRCVETNPEVQTPRSSNFQRAAKGPRLEAEAR